MPVALRLHERHKDWRCRNMSRLGFLRSAGSWETKRARRSSHLAYSLISWSDSLTATGLMIVPVWWSMNLAKWGASTIARRMARLS